MNEASCRVKRSFKRFEVIKIKRFVLMVGRETLHEPYRSCSKLRFPQAASRMCMKLGCLLGAYAVAPVF